MKCLVLGGRGFIGSKVVTRLLERKWEVVVFARKRELFPPKLPAGSMLIEGDFLSEKNVAEALRGCDACVHAITSTSPQSANDDPVYDVQSNLLPTINLLRLLPASSVKKFVLISSSGAYGKPQYSPIDESHPTNPIGSYGTTKLAIEHNCAMHEALHGMDYAALRVANPFGPGQKIENQQGAVGIFMSNILSGEPITIWGDGSSVRDYLYVDDVANAVAAAVEYKGAIRTFNVGSGIGYSLENVIKAIEGVTNRQAVVSFQPSRTFDVDFNVLDISLANRELSWKPQTTLEQGLERMAKWLLPQLQKY